MKFPRQLLTFAAVLLSLTLTVGCMHPIASFGLVVPGTANNDAVRLTRTTQAVEGADGRLWFLFIPLDGSPSLEEAANRALEKGHGDFIKDAHIYGTCWTLLLFSYDSYSIRGDVGNSETGSPTPDPAPAPAQQ